MKHQTHLVLLKLRKLSCIGILRTLSKQIRLGHSSQPSLSGLPIGPFYFAETEGTVLLDIGHSPNILCPEEGGGGYNTSNN